MANPDLFRRSVECSSKEAFPWAEHIDFYLREMGVERIENEPADLSVRRLEPLSPGKSYSGGDYLSALKNIRSDERVLICLSLLALEDSWKSESAEHFVRNPQNSSFLNNVKAIGKIYRNTMKDYDSFREFLRAVDFAGKFYQREN